MQSSEAIHGDPALKPIVRVHCVLDRATKKPLPTFSYYVGIKHCETGEVLKFDDCPRSSEGLYPTTRVIHGLAPGSYVIWAVGSLSASVAQIIEVTGEKDIEVTFNMVNTDRHGITKGIPDDPRDGSCLDPERWNRDYRNPHRDGAVRGQGLLSQEEIDEMDAEARIVADDLVREHLRNDDVLEDDDIEEARHEYPEIKPRYIMDTFFGAVDRPVTGLKAKAEALLAMATALEGKTESEVASIMTTLRVLVGGLENAVEQTMREGIEQIGAGSLK